MIDYLQGILDDQRAYERHGVGTVDEQEAPRQRRTYAVTFRDSTVVWENYEFDATSFRKAVRKARKWALENGHERWSVYAVEILGKPDTRRYGPFPYNKKWGKH